MGSGKVAEDIDVFPLFKGLPGDRRQCPHWGYVIKGQLRYRYADHEEVYGAGELHCSPPGRIPTAEAGCEYVELSPSDQLAKTMQVVERNMKAMKSGRRSALGKQARPLQGDRRKADCSSEGAALVTGAQLQNPVALRPSWREQGATSLPRRLSGS